MTESASFWKIIYDSGDAILHFVIKSESDNIPEIDEIQATSYKIMIGETIIYIRSMEGFEPNAQKVDSFRDS